jgi:hypothetical protein
MLEPAGAPPWASLGPLALGWGPLIRRMTPLGSRQGEREGKGVVVSLLLG